MVHSGAVLLLLLSLAVSGIKSECTPVAINTTVVPSGYVMPVYAGLVVNDTCTFTFALAKDALLYLTLSELVLSQGASLTFSQPNGTVEPIGHVEILKAGPITEDVKVVFSNTDQTTVKLAVGPNFDPTKSVLFQLLYTVKACVVNLEQPDARFDNPVFVTDAAAGTVMVGCEYVITAAQDGSTVGLSVDALSLSNGGTLNVIAGTLNVTYTEGTDHAGDVVAATVSVAVKMPLNTTILTAFKAAYVTLDSECSTMKALAAGEEFNFTSPNYPTPYANNVNCRTIVSAPVGSVLYVNVMERAFGHQYDGLYINDGNGRLSHPLLVTNMASTEDGHVVLSSGQSLWMNFVSDGTTAATPVSFFVNIKPTVFGRSMINNGTFDLKAVENDTRSEGKNTDVIHQLASSNPDYQVTVSLSADSKLLPTATIRFYDGLAPTPAMLIAEFHSDTPFYPVFSRGSEMLIVASNFLNDKGFLVINGSSFGATFESAAANQNKVSADTEDTYSLVAAPGTPIPAEALWLIQNTMKGVVELSLASVVLATGGNNVSSNVTVHKGLADSSLVLAQFTSASQDLLSLPMLYVAEDGVRVSYVTDGAYTSTTSQVLLQGGYRIITPGCGGPIMLGEKDEQFSVSSPNFPDRYPYNADCKWTYAIKANRSLHMTFADFDLAQKHFINVAATVTASEEEAAANETVVSYGQYGGSTAPDDIIVSGYELRVEFSSLGVDSMNWTVAQGVLANLRLLACGSNLTSATGKGEIASPAAVGTDEELCVWILTVPSKGVATDSVNIIQFDLEVTTAKTESFNLILRDGPSMTSLDLPVDLTSGKQSKVQTRTNQLYVEYVKMAGQADGSVGFKLTYDLYECGKSQLCNTGMCMHDAWKCNGVDDCGDGSDELNCTNDQKKKGYGALAMFFMFLVAFVAGVVLTLVVPPCFRKIRNRTTGSGTGYGNLEEPVV